MKNFLILMIFGFILLTGCDYERTDPVYVDENGRAYSSYTNYTVKVMNELKPPIILIGKDEAMGYWGVTLVDSEKRVVVFGNRSSLANHIGSEHRINDTIVKN